MKTFKDFFEIAQKRFNKFCSQNRTVAMKYLPFIFSVIASFSLAQEEVSLNRLITIDEQEKAGLNKLTATERENLRQLVLAKLIEAFRAGQTKPLEPSAAKQGAVAPNVVPPGAGVYAGVGGGHWVKENIDRGSVFLLEDGSLWEVERLDRLNSRLWLRLTSVTVVETKDGMNGFNYMLVNTNGGEAIHAKLLGKTQP